MNPLLVSRKDSRAELLQCYMMLVAYPQAQNKMVSEELVARQNLFDRLQQDLSGISQR